MPADSMGGVDKQRLNIHPVGVKGAKPDRAYSNMVAELCLPQSSKAGASQRGALSGSSLGPERGEGEVGADRGGSAVGGEVGGDSGGLESLEEHCGQRTGAAAGNAPFSKLSKGSTQEMDDLLTAAYERCGAVHLQTHLSHNVCMS